MVRGGKVTGHLSAWMTLEGFERETGKIRFVFEKGHSKVLMENGWKRTKLTRGWKAMKK